MFALPLKRESSHNNISKEHWTLNHNLPLSFSLQTNKSNNTICISNKVHVVLFILMFCLSVKLEEIYVICVMLLLSFFYIPIKTGRPYVINSLWNSKKGLNCYLHEKQAHELIYIRIRENVPQKEDPQLS